MEEKSDNKKVLTAIILCSVFLLLIIFRHNIDVYFDGINYILWMIFMLAVFLVLAVFFIKSIRRSVKKRKHASLKTHLPTVIYTLTLLLCYLIPGSESFESDAVIVAGYEGTQNQNIIKFRKNKTFEMNSTAIFGYNQWFTGTYRKKGDTLFLTYETERPRIIGRRLVQKSDLLITVDKPKDTTKCCVPLHIYKKTD